MGKLTKKEVRHRMKWQRMTPQERRNETMQMMFIFITPIAILIFMIIAALNGW